MERICSTLNEFLTSNETGENQEGVSFHLQSQVMITLTTILIELSVIRSQPRVFESFVEVCFDIISKTNTGNDRMLRETVGNYLFILIGCK